MASIARVLVDSPLPQLDRLFDYAIPEELRAAAVPGVRVRVPLRSAGRITDGYLIELGEPGGEFAGSLSELDAVVSTVPVLTPEVWTLARRASDRAAGSAMDIIRLAVPTRQVRVEKAYLADQANPPFSVVIPAAIAGYPPGVIEEAVASGARVAVDALPLVHEVTARDGGGADWVGGWAVTMAAAAAICLAAGKQAILAVPDYRDQEQLMSALRAVLPAEAIVRLDSKQSNPDRYRAFLRCLGSEPLAIVGNRSVVYAPAEALGLIAVWDDGDPLHSEPLAPYVHTRDAALLRQEQQASALLFFGYSRSAEVQRLVEVGWVGEISPAPRAAPKVVPTAQQSEGNRLAAVARIPSSAWRIAREGLQRGPVLVQVARPGYAPRLACAECGQTARCLQCEGPLAQKRARTVPACAWCGALAAQWRCGHCEGTRLRNVGIGAGRTAEELGRAFPGVRVIVADGERPVLSVGAEPALVIATRGAEPVAAGGYRAVLLLDGERMIARESLRVAEDCLRWWSNAAALAAPGATTVLVGIGGALASAIATWRQSRYAAAELEDRRRLRFPPAVRVATLTGPLDDVNRAVAAAGLPVEDVLGPVELESAGVRTILRFDYSKGAEVAADLRAELIRSATSRRRVPGKRGPGAPSLRLRLDDVEPFLQS